MSRRTKSVDIAITPPPPGTYLDAQGRWVPARYLSEPDQLRDQLVGSLTDRMAEASAQLAGLKAALFADLAAHVQLAAEAHGVNLSGRSGGVTLNDTTGCRRIERVVSPRMRVGAAILAAEALVSALITDLTSDARPELRALVSGMFRRDAAGNIAPSRLLDFIRLEIPDDRWRRAQAAVRAALESDGQAVYFRGYTRTDPTQPWEQIPLDFSRIPYALPELQEAAS